MLYNDGWHLYWYWDTLRSNGNISEPQWVNVRNWTERGISNNNNNNHQINNSFQLMALLRLWVKDTCILIRIYNLIDQMTFTLAYSFDDT